MRSRSRNTGPRPGRSSARPSLCRQRRDAPSKPPVVMAEVQGAGGYTALLKAGARGFARGVPYASEPLRAGALAQLRGDFETAATPGNQLRSTGAWGRVFHLAHLLRLSIGAVLRSLRQIWLFAVSLGRNAAVNSGLAHAAAFSDGVSVAGPPLRATLRRWR